MSGCVIVIEYSFALWKSLADHKGFDSRLGEAQKSKAKGRMRDEDLTAVSGPAHHESAALVFSEKEGNIRKRQKRTSDEYKEARKMLTLKEISELKDIVGEEDPERNAYTLYCEARRDVPPDDVALGALDDSQIRQLYLKVLEKQLQAYSMDNMDVSEPGLRRLVGFPATMRALLALFRDPLTFDPEDWPAALMKSVTPESSKGPSSILTATSDDDEISTISEKGSDIESGPAQAQIYTRFYESTVAQMLRDAKDFDSAHPHYTIRSHSLVAELETRFNVDTVVRRPYSGVAIQSTPVERLIADFSSKWRMISDWLAISSESGMKATVWEWKELETRVAHWTELRDESDVAQFEFLVVLASKPLGLNSAHGGNGLPSYKRSPSLKSCIQSVNSWSATLEGSEILTLDNGIIADRQRNLQEDIEKHFQFMQSVFEQLDEESTGPAISEKSLRIVSKLASAITINGKGQLDSMPLIAKDITQEAFFGGPALSYRGRRAGHGPWYEAWLRRRAFNLPLPTMEDHFDQDIANAFGPFCDLWCIILVHRHWVIIIVILFLSRYLLLFRKHNVALPLILVHSSKVCNIFLSGFLKSCWKPDLSDREFEAFMTEPTIDNMLAVLPGSMTVLSRDCLENVTASFGIDDWEKLIIEGFLEKAGETARVAIGPHEPNQAIMVMSRHTGYAKYMPQVLPAMQAADELVYLKYRIASKLASTTLDDLASLQSLQQRINNVSNLLGVSPALSASNRMLARLYTALTSLSHRTDGVLAARNSLSASVASSQTIQTKNLQHLKAVGSVNCDLRVQQALSILKETREALDKCSILPSALQILCPTIIQPGSVDHLQFLVEFVEEGKDIVRTAAAWSMSHSEGNGYNTDRQDRLADTGIAKPIAMILHIIENKYVGPAILECSTCKRQFLVPRNTDNRFQHTCSGFFPAKPIKANGDRKTEKPVSEIVDPMLDQEILEYVESVKNKILTASKSTLNVQSDKRFGSSSPEISVVSAAPLPHMICGDKLDPSGEVNEDSLSKAGVRTCKIVEALDAACKKRLLGFLEDELFTKFCNLRSLFYGAGQTPRQRTVLLRKQLIAYATEFTEKIEENQQVQWAEHIQTITASSKKLPK